MTRKIAGLLLLSMAAVVHAQPAKWPAKPVRVIVPIAPGGSVDIVARMTARHLTDQWGEQFIVDNRPGAGSTTGVALVARANPDGYTLLMMSSAFAGSVPLYKLPYDPLRDIAPVALIADGPMLLAVHPSVKALNLGEFIELARAKPGALNYGSGGSGSATHLAVELLRQMTNTQMTHVPYKGIGPAMADLLAGQIQFYVAPGAALLPHINTGRLRLLAVTGEKRSRDTPDAPAINELVPGYSADFWYGFGAPAGTPPAVIALLNEEIARMVKLPEVIKRLRTYNLDPAHTAPDGFTRRIVRDIALWTKVVRNGNIKVE